MGVYRGRILEVNLTTGAVGSSTVDKGMLRQFIGGTGLSAKLLFDRISPDVDLLSEENILFVMTGPLSGTNIPGGSRFSVCAKSPLTNMWGESSCGGTFAAELRSAGWDGIAVEAASGKPVYMVIEDDKVEIKDAFDLWGKDNFEVTALLEERHGGRRKVRVLAIGRAGENLVKYAAVCNGPRDFAGRCGMGAVMGLKKLKAIVVRGTGKAEMASPTQFASRRKQVIAKAKENLVTQFLGAMGTNGGMDYGVHMGDVPGKNWAQGNMVDIASRIGGAVLSSEKYLTGTESCRGCSVGCKRVVNIKEGPYRGMAGPGPEYQGAASLGGLLLVDDMAAVIKLNEACNDYGLDVISCGCTIAMAMDCFENGVIGLRDTDGIDLRWGNAEAALKMIAKIARRDGFGDVLADGSKRAAQRIGKNASDYAVEIKGLEVPMHDPRAMHGLGLSYATGVRGACHTNDITYHVEAGTFVWPEIGIHGGYPQKESQGKGETVVISQNIGMVYNSAPMCYMLMPIINGEDLVDLMRAASGFDYDLKELMECGERIWCLKRGLSNLMGITAADDRLPKRIMTPLKDGPTAGFVPNLELMLKEYYPLRGLDTNGRPSKEKLNSLGLSDLAAKLH
jgi:aldehyde:ferredoxin oxidoreductase